VLKCICVHSSLHCICVPSLPDPDLCPSYPLRLIVPICTPHLDIIRGARLYREGRFPTLCWVHRKNGAALLRAAATNTERYISTSQYACKLSTWPCSQTPTHLAPLEKLITRKACDVCH